MPDNSHPAERSVTDDELVRASITAHMTRRDLNQRLSAALLAPGWADAQLESLEQWRRERRPVGQAALDTIEEGLS